MLKKVIVASSLALGFFVSFQVGNSKGSGGASEGAPAVKVQLIQEVKACTDQACEWWIPNCC